MRKGQPKKKILPKAISLLFAAVLFLDGCAGGNEMLDNYPYEPDTPAPAAHEGTFESEHGTMVFSGDGESIEIDFDEELAGLLDLPSGKCEGTYVFLSGDLPPHGSFPVRYDTAHEMQINIGEKSVVVDMGVAAPDGSTAQIGVNTVTPEYIPMLFHPDGSFFHIEFVKKGSGS